MFAKIPASRCLIPINFNNTLINQLGHKFKVITNLRRADVREDMGWVVLELEGEEEEIDRGLEWMTSEGVRVDPVSGDVIEG